MSSPGRSVRARLTLAVALVVGALAVASALIAPRIVSNALVDDLLDAESARVLDEVGFAQFDGGPFALPDDFDTPELTALLSQDVAQVTGVLERTGTLERLRSFRDDGEIRVSSLPGTIAIIDGDGRVQVRREATEDWGRIVTQGQLDRLAAAGEAVPIFTEFYGEGAPSLEDLLGTLDRITIGEDALSLEELFDSFDITVDGTLPSDFNEETALELFNDLSNEFQDVLPVPDSPPTILRSADDYSFGVRSVDGLDVIVAAPLDSVSRTVDSLREALWIAVPITMLVAGFVTWLLAGRALRPVRAITERTATIHAATLHERVPVPRADDEISRLATVMNSMLDRLQRDDARRRQFVSDASHELRSPIAAIRTQAEAALAERNAGPAAGDDELAAGVLAEAERMSMIVSDLLALARHDEGLAPPGVVLDLDDIVLADAARTRRVAVQTAGVSAGRVRGRADEMSSVVAHLLDNAARHADELVRVTLTTRDDRVELTVEDDGPGVPEHERERVFERFVRLDEARQRDTGGAGLGLAVVAGVVRSAGGTVSVTSAEPGGARFVVSLPAAT